MAVHSGDERITALQAIPSLRDGASRFGLHFMGKWVSCPRKAALEDLLPHPEGGTGLAPPHTKRPLGVGWTTHEGLAHWYLTRCAHGEDNGQPDLPATLDHLTVAGESRRAEWEDDEEWAADMARCRELLTRYHQWYGPGGLAPEWPDVQVFVDDTGPWIERTIEVPIGDTGLVYTCRPDMIATHLGMLAVWEHKTSSGSGISALRSRMHLEAQPTGELRALRHAHGTPLTQLSAVVINILNTRPAKQRTDKSLEPFARERVTRSPLDFFQFDTDVEATLLWIGGMILHWQQLQARHGLSPWEAANLAFPKLGTFHGACHAYNSACTFAPICMQAGREERMAINFRPRTTPTPTEEHPDA